MKKISLNIFNVVFLSLAFTMVGINLYASDAETCLACHGTGMEGIPSVNHEKFQGTVHGAFDCTLCHEQAIEVPHPEPMPKANCNLCHSEQTHILMDSEHGQALSKMFKGPELCSACHGKIHQLKSSNNPESNTYHANIQNTCGRCHNNKELMKDRHLSQDDPVQSYLQTVHGKAQGDGSMGAATCSDCHGHHDIYHAKNPNSRIYKSNVPSTCGACHGAIFGQYLKSIHGKANKAGNMDSPVCTDCHGEHNILPHKDPGSSVNRSHIIATCSDCHASEPITTKNELPADRVESYHKSYHGLANRLGGVVAANCASCHGWHDILPSSDPESRIHPENLPQTCSQCHSGVQGAKIIKGKVHTGVNLDEEHPLVRLATLFYLFLIPLTIGFMSLHNASDFVRKIVDRLRGKVQKESAPHKGKVHMTPHERVQHGFLILTFITLAYSGFALKFPEAWWAAPFVWGGENFRKGIHRGTAVLFSLTLIWHAVYMIVTYRGRHNLRALWIGWGDLKKLFAVTAYNLGLRKTKPHIGHPSYVERMEYWALMWGSLVMIATGAVLALNNLSIRFMPLWVSDLATVVHYYEAVLACLAILVWHWYWVIVNPEVFPMDWTWLLGRKKLKKDQGPNLKDQN